MYTIIPLSRWTMRARIQSSESSRPCVAGYRLPDDLAGSWYPKWGAGPRTISPALFSLFLSKLALIPWST